jgi:hypothetical protein
MRIYTRRNAVLGWIVYRVARRELKHRVEGAVGKGHGRRWGLLAGLGVAAGAAAGAIAIVARRGRAEPARVGA